MSLRQKKSIGVIILIFLWCLQNSYGLQVTSWYTTQWRYQLAVKIGYLRCKFHFHIVSKSWDTKGGYTLPSTHTVLEKSCALVSLTHYCVHLFLILCVAGVYELLFSQLLDMGVKLNFFQKCCLLKDDNC